MRAALPLAHHRHDLRHIIQNLNDKGYVSKYMWGAQKATTYGDFLICIQEWIKEQPEVEALLHPDRLDSNTWTYYAALNDPHPHYLFGLTGSQIVEGEMNRLKISGVRHKLPLKAMTNFITLYTHIVEGMKADADEMVAGGKLLTTYASLVCRRNLNEAQHYDVRHLEKHKYEVKRKGQSMRVRLVVYDEMFCSCGGPRLEGLPCRHLLAIYLSGTARSQFSPERFMQTSTRGPLSKKRKEGLSERGFAPLGSASINPWSQLSKSKKCTRSKSKKNVNENNLEAALEQEAEKPERSLRGRVAAAANSLFGFFGGDEGLDG
ncbi:hypothetical protein B484DRAFT_395003 [Ochromonadaceae sp. CCMP2298]|nr:hypothetical protein B484DRAFT_395003 [Ochromonadaceae sp. CCMP2298]